MATPPAAAPSPVRLRLVFDNRRLLRRAQRDDGLRRCWLLLRPELATVADLADHVADRFRLRRSCPRGVVLSMDGFALPPFESTCIFRDNDIIRVKQKSCNDMVRHNDVHHIQDPEIVEKRPLLVDDEILAIEYKKDVNNKQEEEQQYDHQHEENTTITHYIENDDTYSKRKSRDGEAGIAESSKKKRLKVTNPGNHIGCSKEDNMQQFQDQSGPKKSIPSFIDIDAEKTTLQATTVTLGEEQKAERKNQTELNYEKVPDCNAESGTTKEGSRSARRKKLKRKLRQKAKAQLEENVQEPPTTADCPSSSNQDGLPHPTTADCPSSSNQDGLPCPSSNQNESHVPFLSHKTDNEESDISDDDIVPVVVRPGHIRFERAGNLLLCPYGEELDCMDQSGESNKSQSPARDTQGTFQWSGTMSKKQGQKWGMNNSNKKNAGISYHARISGSGTEVNNHVVDSKISGNGFCGVHNEKGSEGSNTSMKTIADEGKSSGEPLDFESLYPLTRLPKEGDLIAYRLVELSSSWCPEISSYRVGKVLIYDPISLRIILLPVPEYPIITEETKCENESDMLVDMSPYNEDGSLEIEYSSLLDVRLLKGIDSVPTAISTPSTETGKKCGSLAEKPTTLDKNKGNIQSQKAPFVLNNAKAPEATAEKTQNNVWEENGEAPKDKADVKENGWGTWTPNASTSAWSLRALRSSALGPTVAILRGKNSQSKPNNRKYGK
ncbi:hypothetical protein ACP70R_032809 [Stipagrostis hirtigluma subsp. patula]